MRKVFLLCLLVAAASAHLCLLGPRQRGTMEKINTQGADDCGIEDAPCGGRKPEQPSVTFERGKNASITFQKNLDHFNAAKPGAFFVILWDEHFKNKHGLLRIPDSADAKSGHLYTPNITIAKNAPAGPAVLQVNYETSNPKAPANFFQCADIMII